jgi:hypothetical protein
VRNDGTAGAGVPAKTTLTVRLREVGVATDARGSPRLAHPKRPNPDDACGLTLIVGLARSAQGASRIARIASRRTSGVEPVDEQHAVEVVGLVLHAASEVCGALDRDRVAVHVLAVGHDVGLAPAVEGQTGNGQAAFRAVLLLVVREVQHRVHQMPGHRVVDVIGEHPQAHADLRRREALARGLEHRLGEVGHERAQLLVEVDDHLCRGAQDRVSEEANGLHGHGSRVYGR